MPTSSSVLVTQAPSHQSESTSTTNPSTYPKTSVSTNRHTTDYERKYNITVHGVPENPHGIHWTTHASKDLNTVSSIISTIDNSITTNSIRDCYHLEKYSGTNKRPHPVLVRLYRSHDAQIILSKRSSLKGSSTTIKPDMSHAERTTEQILLKEHWQLIQSDSTNNIKIRGSRLFINGPWPSSRIKVQYIPHISTSFRSYHPSA